MSFNNQDLTIHTEKHTAPVKGCEFCIKSKVMFGGQYWTDEELKEYSEFMNNLCR